MITFQVEPFAHFKQDAQELLPEHYEELALDKGKIQLGLQYSHYEKLDEAKILHIATVRDDGRLVGYFLSIVHIHPHYEHAGLMASSDMYFVKKEYRKGTGARLFLFVQQEMKRLGVVKMYWTCKVHEDHSQLFEKMGFKNSDKVFTKCLL